METDVATAGAKETFNQCWTLLETPDRTPAQDVELVGCAFTSRYLWQHAGGPQQIAMADWMVSRAAAAVAENRDQATYGALAIEFALLAEAAIVEDMPDWMYASNAEAMARAAKAAGDSEAFASWATETDRRIALIAGPEDQALIVSQLGELR